MRCRSKPQQSKAFHMRRRTEGVTLRGSNNSAIAKRKTVPLSISTRGKKQDMVTM